MKQPKNSSQHFPWYPGDLFNLSSSRGIVHVGFHSCPILYPRECFFFPCPFLSPTAKVPEQRPAGWYEFQILLDAYLPQQLCSGCLGMVCYSLSGVLSKSRSSLSNFVPGTVLRKKYISYLCWLCYMAANKDLSNCLTSHEPS